MTENPNPNAADPEEGGVEQKENAERVGKGVRIVLF